MALSGTLIALHKRERYALVETSVPSARGTNQMLKKIGLRVGLTLSFGLIAALVLIAYITVMTLVVAGVIYFLRLMGVCCV